MPKRRPGEDADRRLARPGHRRSAAFFASGEPARAAEYANRALELPPPTSDAPIRATLEQARQALTARDSEGP